VIEKEGQIVATGTLFIEQKILRNTGKCGHIEDIVRAKRDDCKGIGGVVVKTLREIGEAMGCYKIILDCKEELLGFYGSCGFERKEVQAVSYTEAVLKENKRKNA
jgi:glucosamine-phosphate N-acetyltransferase